MSGLPCSHAISAIQFNYEQPEAYVHEYYSKSRYLDTYAFMIHPVPDMHEYEEGGQKLNPPEAKKLAGRLKKLRNRQADEPRNPHKASRKNINVTCAKCLQKGHNQRSCIAIPIFSLRLLYSGLRSRSCLLLSISCFHPLIPRI